MRSYAEDAQAMALIQWRNTYAGRYPELAKLYHCPNGGYRNAREAARLKAMGVVAGTPDYHLPVPSRGQHGLWIELKAGKNRATKAQLDWIEWLQEHGHAAMVCTGWTTAAWAIANYLGLPEIGPK